MRGLAPGLGARVTFKTVFPDPADRSTVAKVESLVAVQSALAITSSEAVPPALLAALIVGKTVVCAATPGI